MTLLQAQVSACSAYSSAREQESSRALFSSSRLNASHPAARNTFVHPEVPRLIAGTSSTPVVDHTTANLSCVRSINVATGK